MPDFLQNLWNGIIHDWNAFKTLEVWATVLGIAQVILAYRNSIINFVFAIGASAIMVYLFAFTESKLYAEAILQLYYLIMAIYGIISWSQKSSSGQQRAITFTDKKEWIITGWIALGGTLLTFLVLEYLTDSNVPLMDAAVFGFAWAGTWLMTQRKVENWIILNISNLIAIPLLYHKHLPFFSVLTLVLFVVAIMGYFNWRKQAIMTTSI